MTPLDIRLIEKSDATQFFELVSSNRENFIVYFPITCKNNTDFDSSKKYVDKLIGRIENKEMFPFVIIAKEKLIGVIYVRDIDWRVPKAELAYFLDENYFGKGIMTQAVQYLITHCFEELKMNKLYLRVVPRNKGSIRIAQKCGFEKEGLLKKEFVLHNKEIVDIIYYGLINPNFNNEI